MSADETKAEGTGSPTASPAAATASGNGSGRVPQLPIETDRPIRLSDDLLMSPRDLPIGGQAVMEGVMMRGTSTWAVAVRLPADKNTGATPDGRKRLPEGWRLAPHHPNGGSRDGVIAEQDGKVAERDGRLVDTAGRPVDTAGRPVDTAGRPVDSDGNQLGEIEVHSEPFVSSIKRHRLLRIPVIRGVVALFESMKIGITALLISANSQLSESEQEEMSGRTWAVAITIGLVGMIGLFFVLPVVLTNFGRDTFGSSVVFVVVEKLVRISILIGYIWLISQMRDLRRVYEYHGAEHKTIACYEAGEELTPENAKRYSRFHIRCGTSFLLITVIVAFLVFVPLGVLSLPLLIASRVLGFPLVVGISYEAIRWAGRNRRRRWVRALMWPGIQLQRLTTREPSHDQLAVAIAAMEAVLEVEDPSSYSERDLMGMEVGA
jgi:uncharacterized protein YqhQ